MILTACRAHAARSASRRPRWLATLLAGLARRRVDAVRHPGDALRLGAGLATLAVTSVLARTGRPSRFEVDVFWVVHHLPDAVERPVWAVMQAGSLAAVRTGRFSVEFPIGLGE